MLRVVLSVAAASCLLGGCVAMGAGFFMSATGGAIGGASMDAEVGKRSVQTSYPKLGPFEVRLIPYNWQGTEGLQEFVAAMDFTAYSNKPGFDALDIDLSAFRLRTEDGREFNVVAYARAYPTLHSSYGCNLSNGSHRRFPYEPPQPDAPRIPVTGAKVRLAGERMTSDCLNLFFSAPRLSSAEKFCVVMGGIEYAGVQYPALELAFHEHYGR